VNHSRGISLLEVALAVSVSLMLTAGGIYAYRQHLHSTKITQSKLLLETMRQGVETTRYRIGRYPSLAEMQNNLDPSGQKVYDLGNRKRRDPFYPPMGDPNAESPIAAYAAIAPPYGGWLYQPGPPYVLVPKLPDADFPGDPPSQW
jgi:hypothetical protein